MLISDVHWDNPHTDLETVRKYMDIAKKNGYKVAINGDFFCLMQGKADPRHTKGDVRPEHMGGNYFDLVVDTAVEWWKPYAHLIEFIGYGNHETAVLKRGETDVLKRFVEKLNLVANSSIKLGDYSGWWVLKVEYSGRNFAYNVKYHHGYGGGGPATKGAIQNHRMDAMIENADCIWMGHIHEAMHQVTVKEVLNTRSGHEIEFRVVDHIRTPSFKQEYNGNGFHIERGRAPKPIGAVLMEIYLQPQGKALAADFRLLRERF